MTQATLCPIGLSTVGAFGTGFGAVMKGAAAVAAVGLMVRMRMCCIVAIADNNYQF